MFDFLKELGPAIRSEIDAINDPDKTRQNLRTSTGRSVRHSAEDNGTGERNFDETTMDVMMSGEKKEKKLFSKTTKIIIVIMGIIFLMSQWSTVITVTKSELEMMYKVLIYGKAIILTGDVIATFIFLKMNGRKAEIFALIGVAAFILIQYISTALLMGM